MLLLLLKSVEFDDDVALLLSVAGLVMGPHVTLESEIGSTDSAALRTSRACLRLRLYIMLYKKCLKIQHHQHDKNTGRCGLYRHSSSQDSNS